MVDPLVDRRISVLEECLFVLDFFFVLSFFFWIEDFALNWAALATSFVVIVVVVFFFYFFTFFSFFSFFYFFFFFFLLKHIFYLAIFHQDILCNHISKRQRRTSI